MDIIKAIVAVTTAAEHEAEERAHDFVAALRAEFGIAQDGLTARVTALEQKLAGAAADAVSSLSDRVTALEKGAGLTVDDSVVAAAIAAFTAPTAPTSSDAGAGTTTGATDGTATTAVEPSGTAGTTDVTGTAPAQTAA